jgi:raffinose/stachyose/melibiose transport system permease protein
VRGRTRRFLLPPWWFAAPALLVYAVVVLYPSGAGVVYAFTDWTGIGDWSFTGFDNFGKLWSDDAARGSLINTLLLTVAIVVVQNGIGLLLALGVHARIKSRALLRVVFFAPAVVSPVMVAFLWKYVYNPAPDEGLNGLLGAVGLGGWRQDWLGNPDLALWSVAFMVVWQFAGYSMVIFLAGLESVPDNLVEAAMIDGAGRWQRFRHVTWPLLAPAVTVNIMLSTIGGLKLFDQVYAATNGGPGYASETLFVAAVSLVQVHFLRGREVTIT